MRVTLIAHTEHAFAENEYPAIEWLDHEEGVTIADFLAEFAGRACYQSWDRLNPKTATNDAYLAHIIEVGHESVLSHASATFYVTGVSRSLTHELVRHRWLSFSQLSQRYVDESSARMVLPPALDTDAAQRATDDLLLPDFFAHCRWMYGQLTKRLIGTGLTRKQAREAARAVLPNMTETRIVISGNLRAWRDFLKQRNTDGADAEIRLFAKEILRQLLTIAPNSFQDMKDGV